MFVAACDRESPPAVDHSVDAAAPSVRPPADAGKAKLDASPKPRRSKTLTIYAGGDVSFGRRLGKKLLREPDHDPFAEIAPVWADADLRFVNLESVLSDQGGETVSPNNHLVFTGPPVGAKTLERAGIGVVSLANNHAWDYQKSAFLETLDHLGRSNVAVAGAHRQSGDAAYEPTVLEVNGWKIAVFAVTHIWNQGVFAKHPGRHHVAWADVEKVSQRVAEARAKHDVVLVSYHGGSEYMDQPMQTSLPILKAVMHEGADAFIGHHPHVMQGLSWFGDRPAFRSLGNFVFGMHRDHDWTGIGLLAKLVFHRDGRLDAWACPFHIFGTTPMPFSSKGERGQKGLEIHVRRHLRLISRGTGRSEVGEAGEHSCMKVAPPVKRPSPYPASDRIPRTSAFSPKQPQ